MPLGKKIIRWICRAWCRLRALLIGIKIGKHTILSPGSIFRKMGGRIEMGRDCQIHHGAMLMTYGGHIVLGDYVSVGPYTILYGHGGLDIGNYVRIAAHVTVIPANRSFSPDAVILHQAEERLGIRVGDDVWIGNGARILDGITIAKGCVIGAGAVLTRSTEEYGIYGGVPARKIGDRRTKSRAS